MFPDGRALAHFENRAKATLCGRILAISCTHRGTAARRGSFEFGRHAGGMPARNASDLPRPAAAAQFCPGA